MQEKTAAAVGKTITLYELVCQQRLALGPLATTGGQIHLITDAQAVTVTKALYAAAKAIEPKLASIGLTLDNFLPLLYAWVRGESGFDPGCINPNNDKAKSGESAYDAFMHTDWGLAQVNGNILNGLLPDYPWEQQKDTALDPDWASVQMVATIVNVLTWGMLEWATFSSKGVSFPPIITKYTLGSEAYNKGKSGALARAIKTSGTDEFEVHDGSLIVASEASTADRAETAALAATAMLQSGTYLMYGQTVTSRWREYQELLGPTPVLGC